MKDWKQMTAGHTACLCVCAIWAVCSCRMRGGCEWVCTCVWHVHTTCICMCACKYRVWCICGVRVFVCRARVFSPPLVLAWASSVFGSLRARRFGVCLIQVLLPFSLPGAPAVALVPTAHLREPPPNLLSLDSGGRGRAPQGRRRKWLWWIALLKRPSVYRLETAAPARASPSGGCSDEIIFLINLDNSLLIYGSVCTNIELFFFFFLHILLVF